MKRILLAIIVLVVSITIEAQPLMQLNLLTDSLNAPSGMDVHANHLYLADEGNGTVSIIDYQIGRRVAVQDTVILTGLSSPRNLVIHNDLMYIRELDKISIWDVSLPNYNQPVFVRDLDSVFHTGGMLVDDIAGKLSVVYTEITTGKVKLLDLTQMNPSTIDLFTGLNKPISITINKTRSGFYLGLEDSLNNSYEIIDISYVSPTIPPIVFNRYSAPSGAVLKEIALRSSSELFALEAGASPKAISFSLSRTGVFTFQRTIAVNAVNPSFFCVDNFNFIRSELYISELTNPGRVRIQIGAILTGIEENRQEPSFSLFPNPASEWLSIKCENSPTSIKIYNLSGQLILEDKIVDGDQLNVSKLESGIYLVEIQGSFRKLIKQ